MVHIMYACVASGAVVGVEGFGCVAMSTELRRRRRRRMGLDGERCTMGGDGRDCGAGG